MRLLHVSKILKTLSGNTAPADGHEFLHSPAPHSRIDRDEFKGKHSVYFVAPARFLEILARPSAYAICQHVIADHLCLYICLNPPPLDDLIKHCRGHEHRETLGWF